MEEFQYLLYQESAYADVKNVLIQKYGAPLYTSFGNIAGTRIDVPNKELSILAPIIRDYNGWILQYDDCYVFLEISNVLFSKAGSGIPLYLVNYKMLTYEEMEEYLAIQQGFMEYVNNSFHNDLYPPERPHRRSFSFPLTSPSPCAIIKKNPPTEASPC